MQTHKKQKVEFKVEEVVQEIIQEIIEEEIIAIAEKVDQEISEDEITPEYSICLNCNGECNMHSQLCSLCLRRGLIPE